MESHLINSTSFQSALPKLPFLILHGTSDRRIPFRFILQSISIMEKAGANIELRSWEGEDHFLMFHQRHDLKSVLVPWIQQQESTGETSENL